jgi:enamine deaminase RidA (YjgF/YER057c/UK114 family)
MPDSQHTNLFNPETICVPTAGYSQVPFDKSANLVGRDDFLAQAEQVFRNIKAAVEAVGGSSSDVVKLNYYCVEAVDPSLIPQVLKVRDQFVDTKNPPISTFVVVQRLVRPEWLIEIEAIAVVNR